MKPIVHQASCVALNGRAVLIEGPPGIGKSSLALALIDRGAVLVSDDSVALQRTPLGQLIAAPAPNIAGLLEVRGVGLLPFPTTSATVSLVIRLDPNAPRHIDAPAHVTRSDITVPLIALYPEGHALALRAELALKAHGLTLPEVT